jgi:hypothetical protein
MDTVHDNPEESALQFGRHGRPPNKENLSPSGRGGAVVIGPKVGCCLPCCATRRDEATCESRSFPSVMRRYINAGFLVMQHCSPWKYSRGEPTTDTKVDDLPEQY